LKAAGHELLYLSANTRERVNYLEEKYGFLEKFDAGIFSHVVKCKKPDPIIYLSTLTGQGFTSGNPCRI
jgi:FMN phosphatase YigB (HAD superfamily)